MATKKMLIDAAHPEEIRVAVMDGNTLEELDVESVARRQLKGNIYLAKVTRVEPSLQAAFIDYGGNRHGFLAFDEIHPDYYQIPIADREELIAEETARSDTDELDDDIKDESDEEVDNNNKVIETVGGDDIDEVNVRRNFFPAKRYKIQEVIKRRQILLIQVNKEERGNKGAALTTYISLAGRYCVLMPNTGKGGGISRKIASSGDRKRLKTIISEFDLPSNMAVIVRTAGSDRSKAEIKRDYEYLIKLWSNVRDLTLESTAPKLIHQEGSIIKRAIRDHYSRDFEDVIIEGENGYRQAKDLMKLLVPSHAKKVQPYKDPIVTLFSRYHVESQLETMNSPQVQLPSGGYIVIDITEALIAIDVNSGRATRGRNIEETAFKTNTEAATEVARQLRLRDLAGLVVIDFIDMEIHRNQTSVERRLKEAMRKDRARIQIGRISPFGLLELSRQRLRPSFTETMTEVCPHCGGSGNRRSIESTALHVLRGIEEEGALQRLKEMEIFVHSQVALYLLNQKRDAIREIEHKFSLTVNILVDDNLIPPDFNINQQKTNKQTQNNSKHKTQLTESEHKRQGQTNIEGSNSSQPKKKRHRRYKGRSQPNEAAPRDKQIDTLQEKKDINSSQNTNPPQINSIAGDDNEDKVIKRKRGQRGRRRRNQASEGTTNLVSKTETATTGEIETISSPAKVTSINLNEHKKAIETPKRRRVRRKNIEISPDESSIDTIDKSKPASKTATEPGGNIIISGDLASTKPRVKRGGWWSKITNS
jgi:ribonuclease E